MKHRIILTSNFSPWSAYSGGGQRSTHHIAEELARRGFDVKVIYTSTYFESISVPENLPYEISWAKFPGVKSSRKNIFRFLSPFAVKKAVQKLITENTIVHSNGEEGALIGSLRNEHSFRWIITPRYPHIPHRASEIKPTMFNALINNTLSKYILLHKSLLEADIICPTSQSSLDELTHLFDLDVDNTCIIPNGIAPEFLKDSDKRKGQIKRIIFFGRLSKPKGIDILLEACALKADLFDELLIIGRGEFENIIEKENKSGKLAGKIKLLPWLSVSELAKQLRNSTIAVLPSREESFGNSIAEAMACGVPVITTNAGSIPEVVGSPENGIITHVNDIQSLADNIEMVLTNSDLRNKLAKNGRERILDNFSWKHTVDSFLKVYFDAE